MFPRCGDHLIRLIVLRLWVDSRRPQPERAVVRTVMTIGTGSLRLLTAAAEAFFDVVGLRLNPTMSRKTLSPMKYKRLALESLRNSLRLFKDATSLYELKSYPTAFQLTVLAIEEFAKARAVDHVYYSALTNTGLPAETEEQDWLRTLYSHTAKQRWHLRDWYFDFSPKFRRLVETGGLDQRKQDATYVGLPRRGKLVNVNARLSVPVRFGEAQAKQIMSLFARELRDIFEVMERNDGDFFGIQELNELAQSHEFMPAFAWPHKRTGLKARHRRAAQAPHET